MASEWMNALMMREVGGGDDEAKLGKMILSDRSDRTQVEVTDLRADSIERIDGKLAKAIERNAPESVIQGYELLLKQLATAGRRT